MLRKAGLQLHNAEDRINQLQTEIERFKDRAVRAETWLQVIQGAIKEKLIEPTVVKRSKINDLGS